eukprot:CAMPEP_0183791092 /NCGR_PEP_ID=MMETSP0803_2-20130417/1603_1 /TAXON_ID=195967 /ORGANISM="Crustomastix stigmata, Strain CCMP3273" /LENGTH=696 /DNA_ID=CAMNT_0026035381 /DNA_START=35 /DNA_END=2125 /DNA_ORIENTATION=-
MQTGRLRCVNLRPSSARNGRARPVHSVRVAAASQLQQVKPPTRAKPVSEVAEVLVAHGARCSRRSTTERLKLEVEYALRRGTTDNRYVVTGTEATAVVDVADSAFAEQFVRDLGNAPQTCSYVVLLHFSPKRADGLAALIAARPASARPLQVWCSNPAAKTLQQLLGEGPGGNEKLRAAWKDSDGKLRAFLRTVRTGDVLELGGGQELRFTAVPTPRWPDALVAYEPATQLLFTSKLFSCHVADGGELGGPFDDGGVEAFGDDWAYYFDCMLKPTALQVTTALSKLNFTAVPPLPKSTSDGGFLATLGGWLGLRAGTSSVGAIPGAGEAGEPGQPLLVSAVCPLHGPVVRCAVTELRREYGAWTDAAVSVASDAPVAVMYASAYGNTMALAQAISRGITKAGVGVEMLNCEFATAEEAAALVRRSSGFCLGSPTLGGHMPTPVQEALGAIMRETDARQKPCGVFGSFGWSGEAVDELESRLQDGGFSFAFDAIRCKFTPTEGMIQICEESGTDLAQLVRKEAVKRKIAEKRALGAESGASDTEKAVGRVVGSLCALTAIEGDARSASLVSWVSQASFDPPALTVAVAKERAVEGLVLPGGRFVLNVLGTEAAKPVSKALLKSFKPGEDRFAALAHRESPSGTGIVLEDALSYLECSVQSRMECGDHWVLLAKVDNGELLKEDGITAVHHRVTGASY